MSSLRVSFRLIIVRPPQKVTPFSGPRRSSTFRKFIPDTHTYPLSWKRPGKRQERTLSGLTENRYTFTAWPALCKTREDQTG